VLGSVSWGGLLAYLITANIMLDCSTFFLLFQWMEAGSCDLSWP